MVNLKRYLSKLVLEFSEMEQPLNQLDQTLTGGNFGTRIFSCIQDISKKCDYYLDYYDEGSLNKFFVDASLSFVQKLSDKMGVIFASLVMRFWKYMDDNPYTKENICLNFYNAVKEVANDFNLKLNYKSFFDILHTIAFNAYLYRFENLDDLVAKVKQAAESSLNRIIQMKAKVGKAMYLGKRSIGKNDPKALAIYITFLCLEDLVNHEKK